MIVKKTFAKRFLAAGLAAGLATTGVVAAGSTANATSAPADVRGDLRGTPMKVMTLNLYLGGPLGDAIAAANKGLVPFLIAAAGVYDTARATNFPLRARWIAATIKAQNPDVLTLNELTTWVAKSPKSVNLPSYDYYAILQKELHAQGMDYRLGSLSRNADIGYSKTVGIPYYNPKVPGCNSLVTILNCQVRLKDSDAVLYNAKNPNLRYLGYPAHGHFATQQTFAVAGTTLSFDRGWASAAFSYRGKPVTVLTSHLEVESQDGKKGGYGPANWPSKVQTAQANELLQIAPAVASKTFGRVILAGDLNSDANGWYSPAYANLTRSYFQDSWAQVGKPFGKSVGATCCQKGNLNSPGRLDSGDPVVPTRIDLVLNHGATAVQTAILGTAYMQSKQPRWQSDHYFYQAKVTLN